MSTPTSMSSASASLLGVVNDAALAAYLLDQAKLPAPAKLRVTLPGDVVLRQLRKDVNRALTAVAACDDPKVLDRCARDSRITVRRAVAANEHLAEATVNYLAETAVRLVDVELLDPLLGRVSPELLVDRLTDPEKPVQMQLRSPRAAKLVVNAANVGGAALVAKLLGRFVPRSLVASALGGIRPSDGFDFASVTPEELGQVPFDDLFDSVVVWTAERARWAVSVAGSLPAPSSSAYSFRYPRIHKPEEVEMSDDAVELLLDPDLPRSQRVRFAGYVARSPQQVVRHLSRIAVAVAGNTGNTGSGNYNRQVLADLTVASEGRLTEPDHKLLVDLVLEHAPGQVHQMPDGFGEGLPFDVQLRMLQDGGVSLTLAWLRGARFAEPTPERIGMLVAAPGSAFSARNAGGVHIPWAPYPATPMSSEAAVRWLLALSIALPDWVERYEDAAATSRRLTVDTMLAAVDAAGSGGVAAALAYPDWLYRLVADRVGDDVEVWENILNLAVGWEQSLSELVSTAALLAGVTLADKEPPQAAPEPVVPAEEQLTLL